ncbi:MAG: translation initiation factor IF-3 [Verrucomicrobiaceae bacterium]|jgi:translation initiation factor IF-3|nr:translation initiation factor IF-3 [Verrucomicrobiaceae bacterium]
MTNNRPFSTNPANKGGKRPQNNKGGRNFGPRRNERIRAPRIRVIGADGAQLGIMSPQEALAIARRAGLDLLEVSPNAEPPVCRILDYGKYMYEESKKQKSHKVATVKVKEIKLRPMIEMNDFMTKIRNAEKFLFQGNKLKITLMMRGREMEFKDKAFEAVNRAIEDLKHIGHADSEPKLMGRNIGVSLSPVAQNQRKLKYSKESDEIPADDSQE